MSQTVTEYALTRAQAIVSHLPMMLGGFAIIAAFWLIGVLVKVGLNRLSNHTHDRRYLLKLIARVIKVVLIVIGCISALGTWGINISALVASLGLLGFTLGFALKDTLSNVLSGFMLLFYQPFLVGDSISVAKVSGEVVDINLRYTVLLSEAVHHMVPNATLLSAVVTIKDTPEREL